MDKKLKEQDLSTLQKLGKKTEPVSFLSIISLIISYQHLTHDTQIPGIVLQVSAEIFQSKC